MPVGKHKRKPKDAKSFKKKLDEKAQAGDYKGIPPLVQEDLEVGGSADYYNKPGPLSLTNEIEYLVFIIYGGFTIGNSSKVYMGNGVGHYVNGESVLTLEQQTALVIIAGP
ncbi:uncharacterized protein PAC_14783 [Phialocephala subalpina]|uniref:Uncharacterized protein n=1 Tax=Phialocephala subalpina TaxID=576137 RepID=A0A1L7XIN0_9HELO|nr:uncharacterized protein PAC_14783 [Phialocephala subalpina]